MTIHRSREKVLDPVFNDIIYFFTWLSMENQSLRNATCLIAAFLILRERIDSLQTSQKNLPFPTSDIGSFQPEIKKIHLRRN